MRPQRLSALVVRWVRLYTTGLPRPVAHRRIEEIQADLHDQVVHDRTLGVSDRRIATRIASRMIRGAAADVAWRAHEVRTARTQSTEEQTVETFTLTRSAVRVSASVLAVLAIPFIGMAISKEVEWSIADFVLAGTLLGIIGICIEAAIRRRGNLLIGRHRGRPWCSRRRDRRARRRTGTRTPRSHDDRSRRRRRSPSHPEHPLIARRV